MELYFYTPEQRRMDCGKLVAKAIQSMGGEGTADILLDQISLWIDQPEELIEPELKRVLRQAIREGFLIKEGKTYLFPGSNYVRIPYATDAAAAGRRKSDNSLSLLRSRLPSRLPQKKMISHIGRMPKRNSTNVEKGITRARALTSNRYQAKMDQEDYAKLFKLRDRSTLKPKKGYPLKFDEIKLDDQ